MLESLRRSRRQLFTILFGHTLLPHKAKSLPATPKRLFKDSGPLQGRWRLFFSFKVFDRVLHPVPFVEPGNVSNREHFVGPFLGVNLRARTVKPD
jgi:hypothetical protein